jgi:hypothetical protein
MYILFMYIEYIYIFKYFLFSLTISCILFIISFFFVYQVMDKEKVSSYDVDLILLVIQDVNLKYDFIL